MKWGKSEEVRVRDWQSQNMWGLLCPDRSLDFIQIQQKVLGVETGGGEEAKQEC